MKAAFQLLLILALPFSSVLQVVVAAGSRYELTPAHNDDVAYSEDTAERLHQAAIARRQRREQGDAHDASSRLLGVKPGKADDGSTQSVLITEQNANDINSDHNADRALKSWDRNKQKSRQRNKRKNNRKPSSRQRNRPPWAQANRYPRPPPPSPPSPAVISRPTQQQMARPFRPETSAITQTPPPTKQPTMLPTQHPTTEPTQRPSKSPTSSPSEKPTKEPSNPPSHEPTRSPFSSPTEQPTTEPTNRDTPFPTYSQTTLNPSHEPSLHPTSSPTTREPSVHPTNSPTTAAPTFRCPDAYDSALASSYRAGSEVTVDHIIFKCNDIPWEFYCTQPDFEPLPGDEGGDTMWHFAWSEEGQCEEAAEEVDELLPSCPGAYDLSRVSSYTTGSEVTVGSMVYRCNELPWAFACAQAGYQPQPGDGEDAVWRNAWNEVGPCLLALQPLTASPIYPTSSPAATPSKEPTGSTMSPTVTPSKAPTGSTVSPTDSPTVSPIMPSHSPTKRPTSKPVAPTKPPTSKPTQTPTIDPDFLLLLSKLPLPYPYTRYTQWTELESADEDIAKSLGYSRSSWDNLELLELEGNRFSELSEQQQQNAISLGLDEAKWDCFVNHYNGYYWENLQAAGIVESFQALGWDQVNWDDGGTNPVFDMYFEDLSAEQQDAAFRLCYIPNSWNWVPLDEW